MKKFTLPDTKNLNSLLTILNIKRIDEEIETLRNEYYSLPLPSEQNDANYQELKKVALKISNFCEIKKSLYEQLNCNGYRP